MDIERLSYLVIGVALRVHTKLGPGLAESAYEAAMADGLRLCDLRVEQQKRVPLTIAGRRLEKVFVADLVVEERLVVEIKSARTIAPIHVKQLLTYLRIMKYPLGLVLNFGALSLKDGIRRVINQPRQ